ncbi:tRNA (adenosine(37)-N6)-threonylcarbamoyltransferase complex ATPase subunit type 1 TsaE [Candidatus Kaiserbacteria bacterium RIFCSPHIGHO2_01_FULL_56_24]|uniref:tRNA threonylcarbamoyladenosine biosynthesis protein TsaE n=1 Tax=Candidatus Kaiserbacteria bacterium RIFCSPHIGHO2_01_FULL_56_24 TaxID=1798487 RepID=A0A1F6DAU0_9BACT|nr:MAG: tRNA (adenosine(37)-N6)-threonylcarbamoyltransferase complex ATPase subunit type 1 TsaE [Candidatus Kaiserbacteria bacterium RIFCSPHIGHO2_01_FULL_56_24]
MTRAVKGSHDMMAEAARFAATLHPRPEATIVALSGDLGAGKTTFVKGVAKALGIGEHVTSPTFVIMKIYDLDSPPAGGFKRLIHIDAYRLKGIQHLKVLGWEDLIKDPGNLILIEWPEKIDGAIPANAVRLTFRHGTEDTREIDYNSRHVGAV